MMRHFLSILDLKPSEAEQLVYRAKEIKEKRWQGDILKGKVLALIFEKSSTRTRVSFEVGIKHLGGETIFMTPRDCQLGRSEPLKDTARVLSRYVNGLIVRTFEQEKLEVLASYGSIPVINALTDMFHPCQVMSDLLTIFERTPDYSKLKIAWIGDGNNMAHSWINAAIYFPFQLNIACPKGYEPDPEILSGALNMGAKIFCTNDPKEAVEGVDYINTDVWASMGQEQEAEIRQEKFSAFQVNSELLKLAKKDVKIMHCLPAHRGEEITEEVLEGPNSIVWDQAENRLHMQKAILEWVYS
ncbi:ornithine carbamoyltransferase [Desulfonauticus submarinus]|nr:ornithine carbamoyltransferase [Desulfonauticus submarinus]